MRIVQTLTAIAAAVLAVSCIGPVNVAWRGVIHHTENRAATEGRTVTTPTNSSGSVEAAKTNDFKTDINPKDTP